MGPLRYVGRRIALSRSNGNGRAVQAPRQRASDTVRDVVIGMADGLAVPFALTAGLSGAVDASDSRITPVAGSFASHSTQAASGCPRSTSDWLAAPRC